jgi:hypothetical protein
MAQNFGDPDYPLTSVVRELAKHSACVSFRIHAQEQMDDRGIDHAEVMTCLCKGTAYALEHVNGELRANVLHRGIKVRVVVAPKGEESGKYTRLDVVTAMECK